MTVKEIQAKQDREAKKFEAAKSIRALLDQVKKDIGADYDDESWEESIIELVTADG